VYNFHRKSGAVNPRFPPDGWHAPRRADLYDEIVHLVIGLIIWSTAGYFLELQCGNS
jgi:hypothetical protein